MYPRHSCFCKSGDGGLAIPESEAGSAIAELVIVAPVLMIMGLLMVLFGRYQGAQSSVYAAARAGVEAAVVQSSQGQATQAASGAVSSSLASSGVFCPSPAIGVDVSGFAPGGSVSVSVTCNVPLRDLGLPGFPASKTITGSASAPVDPYKEIQP